MEATTPTPTTPRERINVAQFCADWARDQMQAKPDAERKSLAQDLAQAFIDQQADAKRSAQS
jgi:hypothetical protein